MLNPFKGEEEGYTFYDSLQKPIYSVEPAWHNAGLNQANFEQTTTWVKAYIDSTGKVIEAHVIKSDSLIFNKIVLRAMIQYKFTPAVFNGSRVGLWATIPFRFGSKQH